MHVLGFVGSTELILLKNPLATAAPSDASLPLLEVVYGSVVFATAALLMLFLVGEFVAPSSGSKNLVKCAI